MRDAVIGQSPAIQQLREAIDTAARADGPVLITGEAGSGQDVVARAIHDVSGRAARPFVVMNCAGLPEKLWESELFGHVRGSFTGAYRNKPGLLTGANTGTFFLDHIEDMPLRIQDLFLRFLETGEIQPIGAGAVNPPIDVRVMAGTSCNLTERVREGRFRE